MRPVRPYHSFQDVVEHPESRASSLVFTQWLWSMWNHHSSQLWVFLPPYALKMTSSAYEALRLQASAQHWERERESSWGGCTILYLWSWKQPWLTAGLAERSRSLNDPPKPQAVSHPGCHHKHTYPRKHLHCCAKNSISKMSPFQDCSLLNFCALTASGGPDGGCERRTAVQNQNKCREKRLKACQDVPVAFIFITLPFCLFLLTNASLGTHCQILLWMDSRQIYPNSVTLIFQN